jgi:hypothetical protein
MASSTPLGEEPRRHFGLRKEERKFRGSNRGRNITGRKERRSEAGKEGRKEEKNTGLAA